jgi:hypothetical protein
MKKIFKIALLLFVLLILATTLSIYLALKNKEFFSIQGLIHGLLPRGADTPQNVQSIPASPSICCTYSNNQLITSPKSFFSSQNLEYDLDAWCYFGRLEGKKDTYALSLLLQKSVPTNEISLYYVVGGIVGRKTQKYDLAGCIQLGLIHKDNPWSISGLCIDGTSISIATSGLVEGRGTEYHITIIQPEGLFVDIYAKDEYGIVPEGFGPNSFVPNWISTQQRKSVIENYNGSVGDYLRNTGDPMTCQGSYYFSQPLLKVTRFTIYKNNELIDENDCSGKSPSKNHGSVIWVDKVSQSFDANAIQNIKNSSWLFFAMSFLKDKMGIMITTVQTDSGDYIQANLFRDGEVINWDLNKVTISPKKESLWTSPISGKEYYLEYKIVLKSPDYIIHIKSAWPEQEIVYGNIVKYEGIGDVRCLRNDGIEMIGSTWLELQPKGAI